MKNTLVTAFFSAAALLGAAGMAPAQSLTLSPANPALADQAPKASNSAQPAVYAPSDIAAGLTAATSQQRAHRRPVGPRTALGAAQRPPQSAPNIPHLCFQPGIGWTAALAPPIASADHSANGAPGSDQPGADHAQQLRRGLSAEENSAEAGNCPPAPFGHAALSGMDTDSLGNSPNLTTPNPMISPAPGQTGYNRFQDLLADNPSSATAGTSLANPVFQLPGGLKTKGSADGVDPATALAELRALKSRAYISPVKLRRLGRDVQDLQTRLELRQMNLAVQKQKDKRKAGDNTGNGVGKLTAHKKVDLLDPVAVKAACAKKGDFSRSKVCALLKH